jgi:uncharacterized oxidoreductase
MQTTGKRVLITGGGSGIGLDLAREFLKLGHIVIICGRTLEKLEEAKAQYPELHIVQCDVSSDEQIQALRYKLETEFGGIDILVNNAGVWFTEDIVQRDVPLDHQFKLIEINVNGPLRMVHYFLPDLLKKPEAVIINVSSAVAYVPFTLAPVYSATKAAVHSWSLSLRKQLAGTNVKVVELMPPFVDTEMTTELAGVPKMSAEQHASQFMKAFLSGKLEIRPGLSGRLKLMSQIAPGLALNLINR